MAMEEVGEGRGVEVLGSVIHWANSDSGDLVTEADCPLWSFN